ncbi:hypothetical protein LA635_1226 [Erwinia amylovora LA635]|nr:hypothetical protein EAM01S_02_00040 [Erwinia amylovora NBRC 12687 = CFBP 1232]CDK14850.1 hypothetical protein LA635_1226 [Erwinia amylovora LA635]CDK18218.1 hypothetical protein LA636_1226 [Erwinia amylovora LA636]CDK21587.1 hypothetical protein LA637_1227 [Erwinia amylovora LA637]
MVAFWSLMHIKLDLLPGFQRSVTVHLDSGVVGEDIIATARRADETEAFGVIKPFNSTRHHASSSLERLYV